LYGNDFNIYHNVDSDTSMSRIEMKNIFAFSW